MGKKKTFVIKKGDHYPKGLHFGLTFKNRVKFRACFDKSAIEYELNQVDIFDINKLFGFSTSWFHHVQSARLGWRCIDGENIELLTYSYHDGERKIEDTHIITTVKPDEWFTCEIIDLNYYYHYTVQKGMDFFNATNKKSPDYTPFQYLLYPYFGGNNPATKDIKIYFERLK